MATRDTLIRDAILCCICTGVPPMYFDVIERFVSGYLRDEVPDLKDSEVKFELESFVKKGVLTLSFERYEVA